MASRLQRRTEAREARAAGWAARTHDKAMRWNQCEACSFDLGTGEGERACHYYGCPTLPDELDVFCPTCNFDFYTREGDPECGHTPRCEFATEVAPVRVKSLREWYERDPARTISR